MIIWTFFQASPDFSSPSVQNVPESCGWMLTLMPISARFAWIACAMLAFVALFRMSSVQSTLDMPAFFSELARLVGIVAVEDLLAVAEDAGRDQAGGRRGGAEIGGLEHAGTSMPYWTARRTSGLSKGGKPWFMPSQT